MRQQVHCGQDVFFDPLRPEVFEGVGGVFHHVVQEAGLLLLLSLPHQADGQYMQDGGVPDHIFLPAMGSNRQLRDFFQSFHCASILFVQLSLTFYCAKDTPAF